VKQDPDLEKLHAERIASLKKEAEKRQALQRKGHGEYREVTEADFLSEVTGSPMVVCHFFHREFFRCKYEAYFFHPLTSFLQSSFHYLLHAVLYVS
jgi:hypothetical protein